MDHFSLFAAHWFGPSARNSNVLVHSQLPISFVPRSYKQLFSELRPTLQTAERVSDSLVNTAEQLAAKKPQIFLNQHYNEYWKYWKNYVARDMNLNKCKRCARSVGCTNKQLFAKTQVINLLRCPCAAKIINLCSIGTIKLFQIVPKNSNI